MAALLLCIAFYLSALIGLTLHFPASLVYFVWPPSVVLFVALLLSPHRTWWVFLLVLFPVHMLVEWHTVAAPLGSLAFFYANVWIQALVGALCVERLAHRPFQLNSLRSLVAFLLGGAGAAALAEAATLATILALTSPVVNFWLSFIQTLLADALTMLVLAPALLLGGAFAHRIWLASGGQNSEGDWVTRARKMVSHGRRPLAGGRMIEASLLAIGLLVVGLVAFGGYIELPGTLPALLYAVLPLLLWTAVRFGLGETSLALCGLTLLSIVYTIHGHGPFTALTTTENLISLQLFFLAITVPLLVLAVIMQERRQAQEALEQSEERYRAVVSNFPNGAVLLFDTELRHLFADGQGVRNDNNFEHMVVGNTVWEVFPAAMATHLAPRYQATLAGIPATFDMVANDRTYYVQTLPVHQMRGTAGMVVMQDITEQRRAEALAELDRAKTTFFSNVSHELRTPLTLLLGPAADALADREEPLPPRQRERLEFIHHGGLRLLKLANTLLDFSRIEAGRIQATYEPTDLAALTAELASSFRSAVERVGLRLVVDCPPLTTLPHPVYVDREMWEKIVLNLLSNALKFTFAGTITVSLRAAGDHGSQVELEVRDTGTGIAAAELPHLFERFHRVRGARARTQEGTGIGLALVWELARLHGGTVRVTSGIGAGSTFIVAIPTGCAHLPAKRLSEAQLSDAQRNNTPLMVPGAETPMPTVLGTSPFIEEALRWLPDALYPEAVSATSLDSIQGNRGNGLRAPASLGERGGDTVGATGIDTAWPRVSESQIRILVADDNADMRAYLSRLLGDYWAVEAVANGAAALASAHARPPDLVLADVMMPGLDGFALLRALRADLATCAIPVLLLSARAGEEATVEGLDAGADDYLVKPFTARELLARVRTHLELARVRAEATAHASQLEAIFEARADGIAVFDTHGRFVRANRALSQILGFAAESSYTRHPFVERAQQLVLYDQQGERIPAELYPHWRVLRGEMLAGANAMDARARSLDGRDIWVSITGAPVRDPDGRVIGVVLITRDVTARRQLEQQVAEHEVLFRTLVENSPDIIARFDHDLRFLYVSPRIEPVTGLPAQALVGKTHAELGLEGLGISAERYETWVHALTLAMATGASQLLEFENPGPDGASSYLMRLIPEQVEGSSVETVLTVTTDITELRRTEQALRAAIGAAEAARQREERRRQEAERREEIAGSLRSVLAILNSQRPLEEILETINQHAGRLLGSAATAIYGPDSGIGKSLGAAQPAEQVVEALTLQAASGLGGTLEHQSRLPFAHAAVRSALATRSPVVVQDLCVPPVESANGDHTLADNTLSVQGEALPSPYQALLIVPIMVHDEMYGCLLLFYTMRCRFAAEEVALAIAYADQAALAIANARLQDHIAREATAVERNRLARELHDTVAQEIFSASLLAESIPKVWEKRPAETEQALKQLSTLNRGALAALRVLLLELRPAALESMLLPDLLRQLGQAMAIRAGVPIAVRIEGFEGEEPTLPAEVKFALYRMAQEVLMNAVKYASAHAITVRLHQRHTGRIVLEIDDDGQGFDPDAIPAGHFGVAMMRERAQGIGAIMRVRSKVGLGTRVVVVWRSGRKVAAMHREVVSP